MPRGNKADAAEGEGTTPAKDGDSAPFPGDSARVNAAKTKGISTKLIALVIVAILLGAGGIFVWAEYLRHWTTADIESQVISDPTEATPGFKHDLAGRTVTVEGKIDSMETYVTTLGEMSLVYTRSSEYIALIVWGDISYEVGDRIEMRVHFEWATCNDESHVYSPQIAFPWLMLIPISMVIDAVSAVRGNVLVPEEIAPDTLRLEVFDQYPALSLSDTNCSLSVGTSSFAVEYIQALGSWHFGREIDFISNLSHGVSENDLIEYVDSDDDGWITAGDYFELSGIERPEQDSGTRTYLLSIGCTNESDTRYQEETPAGLSHLVITNRGLLKYIYPGNSDNPMTPYGRGSASVNGNQVMVTCDRLWAPLSWDEIEVSMADGKGNYGSWYPSEDGLDGGTTVTEDLGTILLGGMNVSCTVTDLAGNGLLNEGDYFVLTAPDGFEPSEFYEALLIFAQTHERIFSADFEV